MSRFEYLTALLGIILAVAVTEVLLGVGRLIRERQQVKFYWVHVFWMFGLLVLMIQRWWAFWQFQELPLDSFATFLAFSMPTFTFVLAALLITPKIPAQGILDLREYYFRQRVFFFPIVASILVQFSLLQLVLIDRSLLHPGSILRHIGAAALLGLAWSKSSGLHQSAVFVLLALFVIYSVVVAPAA